MAHKPFYKLRLKATKTFGINKNWVLNVLLVVSSHLLCTNIYRVYRYRRKHNITRIHEQKLTHTHNSLQEDRQIFFFRCRYSVLLLLLCRHNERKRERKVRAERLYHTCSFFMLLSVIDVFIIFVFVVIDTR